MAQQGTSDPLCGACGQFIDVNWGHECELDDNDLDADEMARDQAEMDACAHDDNEANALRAELAEDKAWAAREGNLTTTGPWDDVAEWLGLNPGSGE